MLRATQDSSRGGSLMENDGRPSAPPGEIKPQTSSYPSVSSSCAHVERSSALSSDEVTVFSSDDTVTQNQRHSMNNHENMDESGGKQSENNSVRSCKRKLDLTSQNSITAVEQANTQSDPEKETCPEGPPPAKKWVIGPLFQSFKSKMASFTEIVMSPVRLFKPHETPLLNAQGHRELPTLSGENSATALEEESGAGRDEVFFQKTPRDTPQKRSTVVQRLCFEANLASDTEEHKVVQSERDDLSGRYQSCSLDNGSSNSTNSRGLFSQADGPIDFANVQQCGSQGKQVYENAELATISEQGCSPDSSQDTSLSLTKDARRKDPAGSLNLNLRTAIRSSPRKATKVLLESLEAKSYAERSSSVQETNIFATLCEDNRLAEVVKHTEYEGDYESKTPVEAVSQVMGVSSMSSKKEKKATEASRSGTRSSLKKSASAKNVQTRLTRSKKEGEVVDDAEETPTTMLFKAPGSVTSIKNGKRKVISTSQQLGDSDKPPSDCNIIDGEQIRSVSDKLVSSDSREREQVGQVRPYRSRTVKDGKGRTQAALGITVETSDALSLDTRKNTLTNSVNMTDWSGRCDLVPAELPSVVSMHSQKVHTEEKQTTSLKTRQQKNNSRIPCKEKPENSNGVMEWCHIVPELSPHQDGYLGSKVSSGIASDGDQLKMVRRNNTLQAKHKLTSSSEDVLGPTEKNLLVHIEQLKVKKADVFEEQRMSMSLTLQVGPEADEQKGNPAQDVSANWPSAKPNSASKRRGKTRGQSAKRTKPVSVSKTISELLERKSFTECVKSQTLLNKDEAPFVQDDNLERRERLGKFKSKSDRQKRRCLTPGWRSGPLKEEEEKKKKEEEEKHQRLDWIHDRKEDDKAEVPVGPSSSGSGSNRLLRSFSCPDIPSLLHRDHPASALPHEKTPPPTPQKSSVLKPHPHSHFHSHSPSKRARRHTVCSVEIEREIAPLCLRKEVHPTGWASLHSTPFYRSHPSSPSALMAALASCFLSSPLAFLSKKSSRLCCDASESGNSSSSRHTASNSSPRSFVSALSPSFPKSLTAPCLTANPAFTCAAPPTPEPSSSSVSSHCSVHEPLSVDDGMAPHRSEGKLLSQVRAVSEEKALSDSEIKIDNKQIEQRKVSSIRIRKALPKPQYNLTPMGLPKAVRIKKKDFSVEEIYTNKNFSKPPEGRLETIFEVPLSRRDGSQSLTGLKRLKRFVEFPEVGVARKPKKPLVGGAGAGVAQRKAAGNSGTGRTRRGVWASARDDIALSLQDIDSLLCSKLNELDSWMAREQMVY